MSTEPEPSTIDVLARALLGDRLAAVGLSDQVADTVWAEVSADPRRLAEARADARRIADLAAAANRPAGDSPRGNALWQILDWALWGAGCGDVLRNPAVDIMVAALPADLRQEILDAEDAWRRYRLGENGHPAHAELAALREAAQELQAALERQNGASGLIPDMLAARRKLSAALAMRPKSQREQAQQQARFDAEEDRADAEAEQFYAARAAATPGVEAGAR